MPTAEVYDALPAQHKRTMQQARISPVINQRYGYAYRCEACGAEWSTITNQRQYRFWWACPQECNWDAIPELGDVLRILRDAQAEVGEPFPRQSRRVVISDRVSLETWAQHVDRLVAEVHAQHQNAPREE